MQKQFRFSFLYFIIALCFFLIEVLIATKLNNNFFIRAYLGDVLVVILLFYFIKAFVKINDNKLIISIFIFSCLVEFFQFFHFGELLGFKDYPLIMTILGNSFSWPDILCYFIGCLILLGIVFQNKKRIV